MSSANLNTRTKILEATWTLMEDNLGQGARMSDIAKAAGISRQALYLHFDDRADLLIATTRYMDAKMGIEEQLAASRNAQTGQIRLREFIAVIGQHFPRVQGVARALLAIRDTDPDARAAWQERMEAIREGCEAAIRMLDAEQKLSPGWDVTVATNLLWTMLSFQSWDQLTSQCHWTQEEYIRHMQQQAENCFLAG